MFLIQDAQTCLQLDTVIDFWSAASYRDAVIKFMKKIKFFVVIFFLFLCSCEIQSEQVKKATRVEGPIDERLEHEFLEAIENSDVIILNSLGGFPSSSFKIADVIIERNINIIVDDICASACAEHILPASQRFKTQGLRFENEPIIGFHWNAAMLEALMKEQYSSEFKHCSFSDTYVSLDLQEGSGVNSQFWKAVKEKLGANGSEYKLDPKGCPLIKVKFENAFWLPDSNSLRNQYGLDFTGKVCADEPKKCMERIDRDWREGTRIVIGNEIYISK